MMDKTTWNSSSRGSDILFWPPWAPDTHRYTFRQNTLTNQIKIIFKIGKNNAFLKWALFVITTEEARNDKDTSREHLFMGSCEEPWVAVTIYKERKEIGIGFTVCLFNRLNSESEVLCRLWTKEERGRKGTAYVLKPQVMGTPRHHLGTAALLLLLFLEADLKGEQSKSDSPRSP